MAIPTWLLAGLTLVKFRYHVTFVNVLFGALIFAGTHDSELALRLLALYLSFIAVNLLYSLGGRNMVPVDVLLNGLPHVLRFLMGALFVGRRPPATHMLAMLSTAVALSCLRRRIELDCPGWEARESLRRWSVARLDAVMGAAVVLLAWLTFENAPAAPGFYTAIVVTTAILIGAAYLSGRFRRGLQWIWTH